MSIPAFDDLIVPYLLGELSSGETARLEAALEEDPRLRQALAEMQETLAEVALSAPQAAPPPAAFAGVRERIRVESAPAPRRAMPFFLRLGSIAAACAATAVGGFWLGRENSIPAEPPMVVKENSQRTLERKVIERTGDLRVVEDLRQRILFLERQNAQAGQKEHVLREALHELLRRSPQSLRSPEFLASLEDALDLPPGALDSTVVALLRAVARAESGPGVAQVTVMELSRPGDEEGPGLAPIATSIISDAFHSLVDDSAPDLAMADSKPGTTAVVGGTAFSPPRGSDYREFYPDAVAPEEGPGTSGTRLDDMEHSQAQSSFIVPDETGVPLREDVAQSFTNELELKPLGLVVFLGEGEGTMSMRGLPPAGPDEGYQLWGIDDTTGTTFSIGMLPDLPGGRGQIEFDVSGSTHIPTRMLLTKEPVTGSRTPSGTVILETTGTSPRTGEVK